MFLHSSDKIRHPVRVSVVLDGMDTSRAAVVRIALAGEALLL